MVMPNNFKFAQASLSRNWQLEIMMTAGSMPVHWQAWVRSPVTGPSTWLGPLARLPFRRPSRWPRHSIAVTTQTSRRRSRWLPMSLSGRPGPGFESHDRARHHGIELQTWNLKASQLSRLGTGRAAMTRTFALGHGPGRGRDQAWGTIA